MTAVLYTSSSSSSAFACTPSSCGSDCEGVIVQHLWGWLLDSVWFNIVIKKGLHKVTDCADSTWVSIKKNKGVNSGKIGGENKTHAWRIQASTMGIKIIWISDIQHEGETWKEKSKRPVAVWEWPFRLALCGEECSQKSKSVLATHVDTLYCGKRRQYFA